MDSKSFLEHFVSWINKIVGRSCWIFWHRIHCLEGLFRPHMFQDIIFMGEWWFEKSRSLIFACIIPSWPTFVLGCPASKVLISVIFSWNIWCSSFHIWWWWFEILVAFWLWIFWRQWPGGWSILEGWCSWCSYGMHLPRPLDLDFQDR